MCSIRNAGLVRSIGAAHVVDYTTEDFTDGRARYDVILDNVGNRPLSRLRRALAPTGTLVLNGGGAPGHVFGPVAGILRAVAVNGLVRERLRLLPHEQEREQLLTPPGARTPSSRPASASSAAVPGAPDSSPKAIHVSQTREANAG